MTSRKGRRRVHPLAVVALLAVISACSSSNPPDAAKAARDKADADAASNVTQPITKCPGITGTNQPAPGTSPWIRQRYGMSTLQAAGHAGQGISVVVVAEAPADANTYATAAKCYGTSVALQQSNLNGGPLATAGPEPTLDVQSVVMGAPNLSSLQLIVEPSGGFAQVLQAIAAGTYGHVDIVTYSYASCLSQETSVATTEAAAQTLTNQGVWILASAGDAGSTACTPKGPCANPPPTQLDVNYPAADPNVLAVGGTQVFPGAPDVVWNAQQTGATTSTTSSGIGTTTSSAPILQNSVINAACAGGGGGQATSVALPVPAWQTGRSSRAVPDVAALAGAPGAIIVAAGDTDWFGDGGTSLASPLTAGGLAAVRGALRADGFDLNVPLPQAVWTLGAQGSPAFVDVTGGSNDLYGVGCCSATAGFDTASGWGTIRFDLLVSALETSSMVAPYTPPAGSVTTTTPSSTVVVVTTSGASTTTTPASSVSPTSTTKVPGSTSSSSSTTTTR